MPDLAAGQPGDGQCIGDGPRIVSHQRHRGTGHGNIRTRSHGNPEIRLGQCRRIIDTITDHGDRKPLPAPAYNGFCFLFRQYLCRHVINTQQPGCLFNALLMITTEQRHFDPLLLQGSNRRSCFRFRRILKRKPGDRCPVSNQPGNRSTQLILLLCTSLQGCIRSHIKAEQSLGAHQCIFLLLPAALHANTGNRIELR